MVVLGTIDLKKKFKLPGQKPIEVLKGVNFSVKTGEKVAIIGRSGAGKSTLLNILGGLERPTSGTVTRPKNIGFVFQQYHLMPELTVLENVLLPTMSRHFRETLPNGAATFLSPPRPENANSETLSRSSTQIFSAVFFPTPLMAEMRLASPPTIAIESSEMEAPERMAIAIFGPTPETDVS